jgi:hypothetical protein
MPDLSMSSNDHLPRNSHAALADLASNGVATTNGTASGPLPAVSGLSLAGFFFPLLKPVLSPWLIMAITPPADQ